MSHSVRDRRFVTAIGEAADGAFDVTEMGGSYDDAFEATIDYG